MRVERQGRGGGDGREERAWGFKNLKVKEEETDAVQELRSRAIRLCKNG